MATGSPWSLISVLLIWYPLTEEYNSEWGRWCKHTRGPWKYQAQWIFLTGRVSRWWVRTLYDRLLGDGNRGSESEDPELGSCSVLGDTRNRMGAEALIVLVKDSPWEKMEHSLERETCMTCMWQGCMWGSNGCVFCPQNSLHTHIHMGLEMWVLETPQGGES